MVGLITLGNRRKGRRRGRKREGEGRGREELPLPFNFLPCGFVGLKVKGHRGHPSVARLIKNKSFFLVYILGSCQRFKI